MAENFVLNFGGIPGAPLGISGGGDIGDMRSRLLEILSGVERLRTVESNVEGDVGNLELYVKEVAAVCKQLFHLTGENLEQEPLRFAHMADAVGGGLGILVEVKGDLRRSSWSTRFSSS